MSHEPLSAPRVLVAEDNRVMADIMRFNFSRAGLAVTLAANGRIAWDLLQQQEFDLLVTDFQMPEMDGGELCRRLRTLPQGGNLPVIMLTAKGLEIDRDRYAAELGVRQILYKPFSPKQLVVAVEELLGTSGVAFAANAMGA